MITTISVFFLVFCLSRSDGVKLQCSETNKNLVQNIELSGFTFCDSEKSSEKCGDISRAVKYVNNSTGLISVDIPVNPFGFKYRRMIKHNVKLFHCKNDSTANTICDCDTREEHQQYTFHSASKRCKNYTNNTKLATTLLFHNVWTDKYQLTIFQGNQNLTYKPFKVDNNFTKPPEINIPNTYFGLDNQDGQQGLQAIFGTNVKFGPPIQQLELSIFNYSDVNCLSDRSVAKVYIDTRSVTEYCPSVNDSCRVLCEHAQVRCVATNQTEIRCFFPDLPSSMNYTGLVRFDNDLRCLYEAYGKVKPAKCCVKDNKTTSIRPTNSKPNPDPEPSETGNTSDCDLMSQ